MSFQFSHHNLTPQDRRIQRFFEIIPGLVSWAVLIGMVLTTVINPILAALIIIAFDFYWLLRMLYITIFMLLSYFRLSLERETNWLDRIEEVDRIAVSGFKAQPSPATGSLRKRFARFLYARQLKTLRRSKSIPPRISDIYHLVIVPIASENPEVVRPGLESMAKSLFPAEKLTVILAVEDRASDEIKEGIRRLCDAYKGSFGELKIVLHPDSLPGEARVKGANTSYGARAAAETFRKKGIPFENVIISCFDADTVACPQYFACLTYYFLICPNRDRASFQPVPVYQNNLWDAPGFARVLEMGSSFFQLTEATNAEKLVTFSSHSMSFKALVDVGYWPVNMISDDSAIYWKSYIHFGGDYRVVPMCVTVSMDVAVSGSMWKTAMNIYKQKRRWAWGVENFPIIMRAFMRDRSIRFFDKVRHGFKMLENHVAWATWPFLIGVIGWLPGLFAGREFADKIVYYSSPRVTGLIFNIASFCLVASIILSLCLLPRKKVRHSFIKKVVHAGEWLLVPFIAIFFSGLPALDAQTRLMLGRYMEFWGTEKGKRPAPGKKS